MCPANAHHISARPDLKRTKSTPQVHLLSAAALSSWGIGSVFILIWPSPSLAHNAWIASYAREPRADSPQLIGRRLEKGAGVHLRHDVRCAVQHLVCDQLSWKSWVQRTEQELIDAIRSSAQNRKTLPFCEFQVRASWECRRQ